MRPSSPLSVPVYHVLLALGDEVLHGYGMMQRFEELTGGADQLLPGTLYSTLARMVELGLIEEARAPSGDQRAWVMLRASPATRGFVSPPVDPTTTAWWSA